MLVIVVMIMPMMMVIMPMVVMAMIVAMIMITQMHRCLGLEGALNLYDLQTHVAGQLHHMRLGRHVKRIRRKLHWHMRGTKIEGQTQQPHRIIALGLEQMLLGRLHLHEPAIVELQGIAILELRRLAEMHAKLAQNGCLDMRMRQHARMMGQADGLDDSLRLDGRASDKSVNMVHGNLQNRQAINR
jgi:hypothetical protein